MFYLLSYLSIKAISTIPLVTYQRVIEVFHVEPGYLSKFKISKWGCLFTILPLVTNYGFSSNGKGGRKLHGRLLLGLKFRQEDRFSLYILYCIVYTSVLITKLIGNLTL